MAGIASNNEMFLPPFTAAWKPDGGGTTLLGPSHGWAYALNGLQIGGTGGPAHMRHLTSVFYLGMMQTIWLLLRGLTWAEAAFYSQYCGQDSPPCGDPLARPFPL
jgi:hypothetical protein